MNFLNVITFSDVLKIAGGAFLTGMIVAFAIIFIGVYVSDKGKHD